MVFHCFYPKHFAWNLITKPYNWISQYWLILGLLSERIKKKDCKRCFSGTNPENRPIERFRSVCSGNTIGMWDVNNSGIWWGMSGIQETVLSLQLFSKSKHILKFKNYLKTIILIFKQNYLHVSHIKCRWYLCVCACVCARVLNPVNHPTPPPQDPATQASFALYLGLFPGCGSLTPGTQCLPSLGPCILMLWASVWANFSWGAFPGPQVLGS